MKLFKGSHFPKEVILMAIRWYLAYPLSYRHVEELLLERGVKGIRCRIEHVFGFMANSMKGKYIRTICLARAQLKIGFMNLVYNFCRLEQLSRVGKQYYY